MQNLLRIGTGLAIVLAFVSTYLWRELRAERQLTADLRAQVAESPNRYSGYVPTQRVGTQSDTTAAAAKNGAGNPESSLPKSAQTANNVNVLQKVMSPDGDLMKDPEFRKARLTQLKMTLRRTYTNVAEELGLSERETDQLFDLLAEQQLGNGATSLPIGPDGQVDRQALEEMTRARQATQRQQDAALLALLGPDRQPKWQEYQQTLSARSRATSMSSMLATSGVPLTESQLRPLTDALIAEEKYVRQEQTARPSAPMTAESMAQQREEAVNRQEESNRRYLEAAAPNMTAQQLALVKQTLEQQIAISRASARLMRERAAAQTSTASY